MLQLPLSKHLDPYFHTIVNSIAKSKDLDCLNIDNYSNMMMFNEKDDVWLPKQVASLQNTAIDNASLKEVS